MNNRIKRIMKIRKNFPKNHLPLASARSLIGDFSSTGKFFGMFGNNHTLKGVVFNVPDIKNMMNKKAEKLLSIWWFFAIAVIGGGIILGVLIYYSADVDVRKIEADILGERIADCFYNNGYFEKKVFEKDFDIFKECGLKKDIFGKGSNYYFNVSIFDNGILIKEFIEGDYSFEKNCRIRNAVMVKDFPECSEKKLIIFENEDSNDEDKKLQLVILSASNQKGGRIPIP